MSAPQKPAGLLQKEPTDCKPQKAGRMRGCVNVHDCRCNRVSDGQKQRLGHAHYHLGFFFLFFFVSFRVQYQLQCCITLSSPVISMEFPGEGITVYDKRSRCPEAVILGRQWHCRGQSTPIWRRWRGYFACTASADGTEATISTFHGNYRAKFGYRLSARDPCIGQNQFCTEQ